MTDTASASRRRRLGDAGIVAIEFAIMLPMLALLVIGTVDFGEWEYRLTELKAATRAGAEWAFTNPTPVQGGGIDTTGITNAVVNYSAQSGIQSSDVSVSTFCTCAGADNSNVSCSAGTCNVGGDIRVLQYIAVQVTQPFSIVWGGTWNTTLNAGTVTRIN
jgi:Flp pilus assembly protein TadG